MDATSIITQVARDEDHNVNSYPPPDRGGCSGGTTSPTNSSNACVSGKKSGCGRSSSSSNSANGLLKRLFSCCWRSTGTEESDESSGNGGTTSGNSAALTNGANGACLPEEVPAFPLPAHGHLLPVLQDRDLNKKCMVIDLDETLVHSSFKPISNADFVVPVEIDGTVHQVYVLKRPNVDEFLKKMGELYECVLFTASLAKYADPVADLLDKWGVFRARLFRESCVFHRGSYVKDLSRLGRELHRVVIMDNSPASYIFHPENAVPVSSWFDDMTDSELLDLIPFLESLSLVDNVYTVLRACPSPVMQPHPPNVAIQESSNGVPIPITPTNNNLPPVTDPQVPPLNSSSPITHLLGPHDTDPVPT